MFPDTHQSAPAPARRCPAVRICPQGSRCRGSVGIGPGHLQLRGGLDRVVLLRSDDTEEVVLADDLHARGCGSSSSRRPRRSRGSFRRRRPPGRAASRSGRAASRDADVVDVGVPAGHLRWDVDAARAGRDADERVGAHRLRAGRTRREAGAGRRDECRRRKQLGRGQTLARAGAGGGDALGRGRRRRLARRQVVLRGDLDVEELAAEQLPVTYR